MKYYTNLFLYFTSCCVQLSLVLSLQYKNFIVFIDAILHIFNNNSNTYICTNSKNVMTFEQWIQLTTQFYNNMLYERFPDLTIQRDSCNKITVM
jgi:hypothetical protein